VLQSALTLESPESVSVPDTVHGAIRPGEGSKGSISRNKWRGPALIRQWSLPGESSAIGEPGASSQSELVPLRNSRRRLLNKKRAKFNFARFNKDG
jgi:hypothetical protein